MNTIGYLLTSKTVKVAPMSAVVRVRSTYCISSQYFLFCDSNVFTSNNSTALPLSSTTTRLLPDYRFTFVFLAFPFCLCVNSPKEWQIVIFIPFRNFQCRSRCMRKCIFPLLPLFSILLPRPPTPCKIIFPEKDFVNKKFWPADDLYVCIISNLLCFASVTLTTRKTCVPACLCVSFGPVNSLCYLSFTDLWLVVSYLTNIFLLINQASCFSFLIKCKDCFVMESAM